MYDQLFVDNLMEMVIIEDNIQEYKENINLLTEGKMIDNFLDKYYRLTRYRLKREDLSNPSKVKDAIKHINLEEDRGKRRSATVPLVVALLGEIGAYAGYGFMFKTDMDRQKDRPNPDDYDEYDDNGNWSNWNGDKYGEDVNKHIEKYNEKQTKLLIGTCAGLAVAIGAICVASSIYSVNDFDRLIDGCEKEIDRIDKSLKKIEKTKTEDNKKEAEAAKKDLLKAREGINNSIEALKKAKKDAEQKKVDEKKKAAMDKAEIKAANKGKVKFSKDI